MKTVLLLGTGLLLSAFNGKGLAQSQGTSTLKRCHSHEKMQQLIQADPSGLQRMEEIEAHTAKYVSGNNGSQKIVVTIPVVVHVLYNTASQNISDAQIQSQMTVLNNDFRKLNSDVVNVPSIFSSLVADAEINFCLATVSPSGAATTGITRTSTTKTVFDASLDDCKSTSTGGVNAWDRNKYLNIWVVPQIKDGPQFGILGYAQFPGTGSAATDGVVIAHNYFGTTGTAQAPYNGGRTATHEVGHWLNLFHIWGDDDFPGSPNICGGSDNVSDTPNQGTSNGGCPSHPSTSCGNSGDMFMNYMDYTNDACMYMFTNGQKARMQALFAANGARASLLTSNGCGTSTSTPSICSANSTNMSFEYIAKVQVGGINNSSTASAGGYGNFTGLSTNVAKGTAYNVRLTPGFTGTTYSEFFRVYVDWNNDKDFDDAGESVYNSSSGSTTMQSFNMTIPTGASTASVRMRVLMRDAAITSSCGTFVYGEVEDYTLNVLAEPSCSNNYESNNSIASATTITANSTIASQIATSTDIDFYKITTTSSATRLKIELSNLPVNFNLSLVNSSGTVLASSSNTGTTAELINYNPTSAGTYYIRVSGVSSSSSSSCYRLSAYTSASNFKLTDDSEVIENSIDGALSIAPNPSNGDIFISVDDRISGNYGLYILDATGSIIYEYKGEKENNEITEVKVDLSNYANGMYFVRLNNNNQVTTEKLILQH